MTEKALLYWLSKRSFKIVEQSATFIPTDSFVVELVVMASREPLSPGEDTLTLLPYAYQLLFPYLALWAGCLLCYCSLPLWSFLLLRSYTES
jgi:hypothetical protein